MADGAAIVFAEIDDRLVVGNKTARAEVSRRSEEAIIRRQ
jgi:hypothetical protein